MKKKTKLKTLLDAVFLCLSRILQLDSVAACYGSQVVIFQLKQRCCAKLWLPRRLN